MARIRSLKPEAFQSETLSEISVCAERTFLGLSTQADDRGRLADKPAVINGAIWPMRRDHTVADLDNELGELEKVGLICRYVGCDGKRYLHLVSWDAHQRVERPSKSRQPRCLTHPVGVEGFVEYCGRHEGDCSTRGEDSESIHRSDGEDAGSPHGDDGELSPSGPRIVDLGPRTVDRVGAARRRKQPPSNDETPSPSAPAGTIGQRAQTITNEYHAVEPMCRWPAVNKIVTKAMQDGRWTDDDIRAALLRLAADKRSVTVETLRVELTGPPVSRASPRSNGYAGPYRDNPDADWNAAI